MTDITSELPTTPVTSDTESTAALIAPCIAPLVAPKPKNRFDSVAPVLEKLFELYPHLFGARFLPLKLGIFQELLAAHPDDFNRDALKAALGVHTRSTRYLQSVAAGNKRHDLQGHAVEDVAPEHVFLSVVELFRRRQARTDDDLRPRLFAQIMAAYEASGLSRLDYLSRVNAQDDIVTVVLEDAMAEVDQTRARTAALIKAYDTSGKSVEEFADSLGMEAAQVHAALKQRA